MRNPFRRTSRPDPPIDLEQQAINTLRGVGTDRANALADEIERGRERRQERRSDEEMATRLDLTRKQLRLIDKIRESEGR